MKSSEAILVVLINFLVTFGIFGAVIAGVIRRAKGFGQSYIFTLLKRDPQKFKDQFIDGDEYTKQRLIQQIQSFQRIKQTKAIPTPDPFAKLVELTVIAGSGQEEMYRAEIKIENKQPKLRSLQRFM